MIFWLVIFLSKATKAIRIRLTIFIFLSLVWNCFVINELIVHIFQYFEVVGVYALYQFFCHSFKFHNLPNILNFTFAISLSHFGNKWDYFANFRWLV